MKNRSISGEHLIRFRKRLEDEERSAATVEKYLRDVAQFASFLAGGVVTKASVARWKERLLEEGQSPSTVNGKLTALDRFLAFAGWADCRVRHLKLQRRLFRDSDRELTREEYGRLVAAAGAAGKERLELLLESVCATGVRVSEVRYLTVEAAQPGQGRDISQGQDPCHSHPWQAVPQAAEIRQETKNRLR